MEKINEKQFDDKIKSARNVIVDFSSPGCAPCKKVPPLIEEIINENPDKEICGYEVDVVDNPALAMRLFVLGVPTVIVFRDGKEVKRFNSVPGKNKIIDNIK